MNPGDARKLLFKTIDMIESPSLRGLLHYIFVSERLDKFCDSPGGRGRHHAFRGGLAYHSCHAALLATKIVDHYLELGIEVNKDMVIAGVLLHDIGKMECYEYNEDLEDTSGPYDVILRGGWQRTKENDLFHHIPIGYGIVLIAGKEYNEDGIQLTYSGYSKIEQEDLDHLLHIILSHHGNKAWSSPVIPQTTEAYIVHSIEMMDGYVDSYSKGKIPQEIYSH